MAESRNGKVKPKEIAERAAEQMQELLGRQVEGVTGLEKDGDDWKVTLEVLELERVPTTTDVLGSYEVTLDKDGELTGAQRTRRYARGEAGEG
ncbi:MAG: gas vesicle protein [Actinobacteria bacterium]|nr:gas vesicle protein [Actinomycetota bacterium]